jgi:hypothetical protein
MAVPIMRLYNTAAPAALNVFALSTDAVTGLSVQQLNKDNAIIDFVNSPDNAAGINHQSRLLINNLEAGPTFFSTNSSSASAGRTVPGPLPISTNQNGGKQLSYNTGQTLGAFTAYSFIVKYANMF